MPDLDAQVKNEGVRILRLCKDLSEFILSGQARKTYLVETEHFLEYIKKSLEAIDEFVKQTITKEMPPPLAKVRLKGFDLIREGLSWIYIFVKEAIDADTLSIPYSLIIFLNYVATELQKPEKVSLVVLGSSDLMYYKYNLKNLRNLTRHIASKVIKDYPVLPEDIGVLKFPYCAAQEVLVNCILFHEMGHYIYEKTNLEQQFLHDIESNLTTFVQDNKIIEELKPKDPDLAFKKLFIYVGGLMSSWADEIFADIVAIRILGPAFHFALLVLEQILRTDIKRNRNFSRTHPADDFRFKIHAKWLNKGIWDDIIKDRKPDVFDRLKECEKLEFEKEDFSISCEPPLGEDKDLKEKLHTWMFEEFEKMVVKVEEEALAKTAGQEPISDFNKNKNESNDSLITKALEHGVVPSTVYDKKKQKRHPNPTTILNSGFFFYLGNMDSLLEKVESSDSDIDKRMNYEKRLNQWLAKAIEDWQILLMENKL